MYFLIIIVITVGVGALQFSSDFPTVVKKSIPFEFSLQLLDYTSKLITNGTDSIALIRLTISKEVMFPILKVIIFREYRQLIIKHL